jgi:hypothetical protein
MESNMYWYTIPIFQTISQSGNPAYVPGEGSSVVTEFALGFSFTIHAAYPKDAPTSAILGTEAELTSIPVGWSAKTVFEAKAHFESVTGRVPTDQEVF